MRKLKVKEKVIENSILSFLKMNGIFCFKVESQGTFDQKIGRYRMKHSIHRLLGVADIIGIFHNRFLAIEVKSEAGKLSDHQSRFLTLVNENGGIGFVARSIDDVTDNLKLKMREIA